MKTTRIWIKGGPCVDVPHDHHAIMPVHRYAHRWLHVWRRRGHVVAAVRVARLRGMEERGEADVYVSRGDERYVLDVGGTRFAPGLGVQPQIVGSVVEVGDDIREDKELKRLRAWWEIDDERPNAPEPSAVAAAEVALLAEAGERSEAMNARRRTEFGERLARERSERDEESAQAAAARRAEREIELRRRRDAARAAAAERRAKARKAAEALKAKEAEEHRERDRIRDKQRLCEVLMPREVEVATGQVLKIEAMLDGPWKAVTWSKGFGPSWVNVVGNIVSVVGPELATVRKFNVVANDGEVTKHALVVVRVIGQTLEQRLAEEARRREIEADAELERFRAETRRINEEAAKRGSEANAGREAELTALHEAEQG